MARPRAIAVLLTFGGLAIGIQQVRARMATSGLFGGETLVWALGWLPSLFGAAATVFLLLVLGTARRKAIGLALLVSRGWEAVQFAWGALIFDPMDLVAAAVGVGIGAALSGERFSGGRAPVKESRGALEALGALLVLGASACLPFVSPAADSSLLDLVRAVGEAPPRVDSVWPGFSPADQGFLVYAPGGSALLVTSHPPPAGAAPVADSLLPARLHGRTYALADDLPGLEGGVDTGYRIGESVTTAYAPSGASLGGALATLYHEAFHTYQDRSFRSDGIEGEWVPPEVLTREFVAMAEVERRILARALEVAPGATLDSLLRAFLAVRAERLRDPAPAVRDVERALERGEGSANLVGFELAAATLGYDPERVVARIGEFLTTPLDAFGGDRVSQLMRWRAYGTGAAMGLLLERKGVSWRGPLEEGAAFDSLLREAVAPAPSGAAPDVPAVLEEFGYGGIVAGLDDEPTPEEEVAAFYDLAPARLVIDVHPRDTAAYDPGVSFNFSSGLGDRVLGRRSGVSRPEPGLTLIWNPELLHTSDPEGAGFTLRVEGRPVALDGREGRGHRRIVVLLPRLPEIDGEPVRPGSRSRPRGTVIEGEGTRFRTGLAAEVIRTDSSAVHVRIAP